MTIFDRNYGRFYEFISTYDQYRGHVRNHLTPYFGNVKINKVNITTVKKFIAHATAQGVTGPTLKKLPISLGGIMRYAVRKRYHDDNPVREITKPKVAKRGTVDFLKLEEARTLIDHANGQGFKTLYTLAVMSGMCQGEILGLRWTDIDWFNCQVHVRRTYNHYSPSRKMGFFCKQNGTGRWW